MRKLVTDNVSAGTGHALTHVIMSVQPPGDALTHAMVSVHTARMCTDTHALVSAAPNRALIMSGLVVRATQRTLICPVRFHGVQNSDRSGYGILYQHR